LRADRAIPLTPADCFLRAVDLEIRRCNGASHNSQLVLRLGPGFDAKAFASLVGEAAASHPILRAEIVRPFGVGAPVYRTSGAPRPELPTITIHERPPPRAPEEAMALPAWADRINEPFDARHGDLLRIDLVPWDGGRAGTDLVMTWVHMLFDGSGSENFLRWLDECFRGERKPNELPSDEFGAADPSAPARPADPIGERGRRAQEWVARLDGFAEHPPRSLAGPISHVRQALRHRVLRFDRDETAGIVAEAARRAGVLTPMLFYLAATIRAHDAVFRARGAVPESYVIPLPVDLRPRGAERAIFRSHVSLFWFQVLPDQVGDFSTLLETLKLQRRESIKGQMVENSRAAMEFARMAPARLYAHMARRNFGGELCSFFFAYTGEFLSGLDRFFGSEIEDGYHVAPVPASPGSCAAMSLRNGRLGVTHVHQAGLFGAGELDVFDRQLRADLLGGA